MTDYQKKRITLMRKQNVGYATIRWYVRTGFFRIIINKDFIDDPDFARLHTIL